MKTYLLKSLWEEREVEVMVAKDRYTTNESLAVLCYTKEGEEYAIITVNLPYGEEKYKNYLEDNCAFVDTNNCPWAEDFLTKNKIARKVENVVGRSGFCHYPLYKFNVDIIPTIKELFPKDK